MPLKPSLPRHLLIVGVHKEKSLKARLELFTASINVTEIGWQRVPNLGCHDIENVHSAHQNAG